MNITDNIVDTFFINQNPGQSGIDKELGQLFDRTVDRQGYDIKMCIRDRVSTAPIKKEIITTKTIEFKPNFSNSTITSLV